MRGARLRSVFERSTVYGYHKPIRCLRYSSNKVSDLADSMRRLIEGDVAEAKEEQKKSMEEHGDTARSQSEVKRPPDVSTPGSYGGVEKFLANPTADRFPTLEHALETQFVSSDKDYDIVREALPRLVGGCWQLSKSKPHRLYRTFRFKTFKTTWQFMGVVAAECEVKNHHPEWANVYNRTRINWVTHRPPGLSAKDIHMARFCDERASELGELPHEINRVVDSKLVNLVENEMADKSKIAKELQEQWNKSMIQIGMMNSLIKRLEEAE